MACTRTALLIRVIIVRDCLPFASLLSIKERSKLLVVHCKTLNRMGEKWHLWVLLPVCIGGVDRWHSGLALTEVHTTVVCRGYYLPYREACRLGWPTEVVRMLEWYRSYFVSENFIWWRDVVIPRDNLTGHKRIKKYKILIKNYWVIIPRDKYRLLLPSGSHVRLT
jgi:hypothetical protein